MISTLHRIAMMPMTSALGPIPMRREEESFAPTAEVALFIAGGLLTLLVIIFIAGLMVSIVREERAAKAASAEAGNPAGKDAES